MKLIFLLILGLISSVIFTATAQTGDGQRGDTDISNNRSSPKSKNDNNVNTEKKTPTKAITVLPGTWVIDRVYRGNEDVTNTDTLATNQTLEFTRENGYLSFSGSEQIDSGRFRVNETMGILYLESQRTDQPTEWALSFDQDGNLNLANKDTGGNAPLTYVYRRTGSATRKR